jgi:hypothetical protein
MGPVVKDNLTASTLSQLQNIGFRFYKTRSFFDFMIRLSLFENGDRVSGHVSMRSHVSSWSICR